MRFTQFLFPDGRPIPEKIDMPAEVEAMASELREAGWSFEIECSPMTGIVYADCCDGGDCLTDDGCNNGPEVPVMVDRLVRSAHAEWLKRGKPHAEGGRLGILQRRFEEDRT